MKKLNAFKRYTRPSKADDTIYLISKLLYDRSGLHRDKRFPYYVAFIQSLEYLKYSMSKEEMIEQLTSIYNEEQI